MMFDFQTLRYSSPMVDLATFIANSTGVDVRKPHFDDIFRSYHTELVKALCEKWNKNEDELPSHYRFVALRKFLQWRKKSERTYQSDKCLRCFSFSNFYSSRPPYILLFKYHIRALGGIFKRKKNNVCGLLCLLM